MAWWRIVQFFSKNAIRVEIFTQNNPQGIKKKNIQKRWYNLQLIILLISLYLIQMVTDSQQCLSLGNTINPLTQLFSSKEVCLLQMLAASRSQAWQLTGALCPQLMD